jgi:hypothetical protein
MARPRDTPGMCAISFEPDLVSRRAERRTRPGLLGWKMRRRYRFVLRHAALPAGARVVDVGGAHGTFAAMTLRAGAGAVTVVEPKTSRFADGRRLHRHPQLHFVNDDILARLDLLETADTLTALHCLQQMGPEVHDLFEGVEQSPIRRVVLQGSMSHASWLEPHHEEEIWGPAVGLPAGMVALLEAHGFRAELHPHRRYPVAVGVR